jgi:hypothetical protein
MATQQSILLYVRPWNVTQMEHLARGIWGTDATLSFASEHGSVDATGLAAAFNATYRATQTDDDPRYLSEDEVADIILRCRLLRSINPGRARRLLVAMERAVDKILTETQPSAMLSLTIDSYVMDVFSVICAQRDIMFIGLVPSFLKEHFRITARGEYVDSRPVTDADIDTALASLIVKNYRPDFLVQSDGEMRRQMWRLWLRNLPKPLWFALRRMQPGRSLNYHYWASQIVATRYWTSWPRNLNGISGSDLAALGDGGGLPLIYLPLQMSPEATIDYWSHDTRWIDYENFIIDLLRRYHGKWRFVVKEHPNLLGYRARGFYKRLEAEPSCVMVAPKVPSNDLVELCQGVLVCTGTAGFEAALRGKPVLSESEPYYAQPGVLLPIDALDGALPVETKDSARQRDLIAHVLRGTLPGRFLNNGKWSAYNPEHRGWSDTMAVSIRGYFDYKLQQAQATEYTTTNKGTTSR